MAGGGSQVLDFPSLRARMVEEQLRARGIRHPGVLQAMGDIPREQFLPAPDVARAYDDGAQPIGYGATISQPYIVALMSEALDLRPQDRVLEVGTGSGYQTAILATLAHEVYTVEIREELSRGAQQRLARLGVARVAFRTGDGRRGWPEAAPFDAIVLTAAPARLPVALLHQLGRGGRLVAPVGIIGQELRLWRREGYQVVETSLCPVRFVPLLGGEDTADGAA